MIVTTDRDIMKKELKKVTRERDDAVSRLNAVSQSDQPANYGTLGKHGVSVSDKSLSTPRDYESIKLQCEKAMAEVQGLLKQNVDLTRKYENCMKEVDYYKKQERAAYTALQNLRMQYEEVVAEKQKLEREVTSLQTIMEDDRKEIADLRRQQQEAMSQEGSGEAINQLYMTTMRKYEAIKDEYDSIRKRYSDLVASHSNNISKLELTQEEVSRLKKQYDEVLRECNEAVREKNCLKQQCTKAITEWDSALREKNKLQEELLKIREKYDEMMKEMNTHLMQRQHLNKDLKRLQIVTTDRDIMKKELKKVTRERDDAVSRLNAVSQSDQPANYGTLGKHGVSVSDKSLSTPRDYESIKLQCEKAMAEVQGLLKQNVDLTRKYENCMKEVDYYKKQERAAYTALQNLRMQYEEVVAEKQKLEREVTSLQTIMEDDRKEIADLRRQQQEAMSQEGSGEAINQLYMTTMRKYEAIKDEYDSIRKRYSDLVASHSNNISKLELTQEEVSRLKKQYDEVLRECNEAVREKNCLKQQCTKAITEWDSALREKNKLQEELLKIREKYDEMMKEMNTHLMQRQHLNKDLKRLQEERNAAMQEYTLVMSERDTVHKEMDKLQEELSQASKKIKTIEQSTNDSTKERESLLLQIEMLKREIAASLHDRDKAIKECNDLRERFGAKEDTNKEWEGSYKDHDNYKQEREMTLKEGPDLDSSSHNMYSKAQKERLDNLDQANQEIDRLRKTIEKLQSELQEAQQEAEVSKRRRDWAFSERDKIVQERESIRAHCDKLRRERDRAVSELAEALRDSDDMKKQRNEASKELKELKERLEAEQEKAAVVRQLAAHNHSRDSAIDTDMQEWETDILHLPIGVVSERDVGFVVAGGADDPHYGGNDGAIYVTHIAKDGPFEGKLRLHDQIINVNGVDCQRVHRSSVYAAVVNGGGWVQMTVRRRRSGGRSLHTVHLHCPHTAHHGLTLHTGVYIANILPGSPAARESNLAVGDRVLNINGKPVDNIGSCEEAQCLLDAAGEVVQLTTLKSHGSSSLSDPLSSSSSGHNITEDDKSTSSSRPYSSPTSPSKETGVSPGRSGSRELVKKLMPGSGGSHSEDNSCKRYGSSEKSGSNGGTSTTKRSKKREKDKSGGTWPKYRGGGSGKVGKAELEYYVKKNILKYPPSDSESIDNSLQISQPPVYGTRPSPLHHDRTPNSRIPHPHSGLYSPPNPPLRSPQGFGPYPHLSHFSLSHPHQYPHSSVGSSISAVSPRYSSPPTLPVVPSHYLSQSRSGDSIFPSGLERDPRDGRGYYESRQASSPTPVGMIGTVSGGVFYHSPSPSLELPGHHKPRTLHHLHPYRPTSDDHPLLPHHSCPPSYHDSQRFTGTMPRKKEDERIR
ncbi:putative discs large protein [Penaeus vannamei]|uniref:Putative discs large protein n=1 Tax=Penaeus vannamei TaxID=6689 RepID=A0A3R7MD35_PENVA|nr:putative discs large protein [Penaeus vannamei]